MFFTISAISWTLPICSSLEFIVFGYPYIPKFVLSGIYSLSTSTLASLGTLCYTPIVYLLDEQNKNKENCLFDGFKMVKESKTNIDYIIYIDKILTYLLTHFSVKIEKIEKGYKYKIYFTEHKFNILLKIENGKLVIKMYINNESNEIEEVNIIEKLNDINEYKDIENDKAFVIMNENNLNYHKYNFEFCIKTDKK